jgi:carboxyl-terminal processing protease
MKKSTRIASYIAIFGVVFSTGLLVGNSLPTHSLSVQSNGDGSTAFNSILNGMSGTTQQLDLKPLWAVKNILEEKYLDSDDLDGTAMSYGAVRGMVYALNDPYTEFMDPQDTMDFNETLNSELEGIGAEMSIRDQLLTVLNTVKGSPAEKAGLLPNDVVIQIDDQVTLDMPLLDAIKLIRGPKGTEVVLTVIREDRDKPFELTIKRDTITLESVIYTEKEGGIWHVEVNSFSDDTRLEFIRAMNEIKQKSPQGMILDLRFNGGGYLNGAVDILSAFVRGETKVVTIEYRDPGLRENLLTDGAPQFPDLPLVVLINRGSASASEIVAAAVQDLKRGVIMGETSYGKGTVQEVDPLPDGSSLRFTIARWLSPLGREFNGNGIEPDRTIELTEEDYENRYDRQLEEAIKYLQDL